MKTQSQPLPRPEKMLILGSGALKIGEAGEFDYSGSQAIKALREEGIRTILVNPNIATIQTSSGLADAVYFLPVTPAYVEEVIDKEKPDGIMLGFGGQTALNCGLALAKKRVLGRYRVRVYGSPIATIEASEDRQLFNEKLAEIDAKYASSKAVSSVDDALAAAEEIGYPVMLRVAYALGGLGSGVAEDFVALSEMAARALSLAPQILIEEYLEGWKEVEYEVMRDTHDNCITICNMENFDPMGIHTGESIVIAPSQTLSNREYHMLREVAIRVVRHLGVIGECNIQYALHPQSLEYRIIEVNARLSRSSALASKATGYPLAFIAAKVALGYGLHELPNTVTRVTKAFFEPALDYVVVKIPRWDLKKFRLVSKRIGSGMKSVGEVMAIGRTFNEALQKALRMLNTGAEGLLANPDLHFDDVEKELLEPSDERIFAIIQAFAEGRTSDDVYRLARIDKWFLHKLQRVVAIGKELTAAGHLEPSLLRRAKVNGFSDRQIARLRQVAAHEIAALRKEYGIQPHIRQIDTLAAEYPAATNYLYLSYQGESSDPLPVLEKTVLILGSGAYRIGSSVEFDWCAVHMGKALRQLGYTTAMLNYNPETVSTDYDESDVLFFDEISIENIHALHKRFAFAGIVVSVGGQIPNNLAMELHRQGIPILGTMAENINRAEDRGLFSAMLDKIGVDQPEWAALTSFAEARDFADEVGYPVLIRPSYVLSGAAMAVASTPEELASYLQRASLISPDHPTVISKFYENAKEIEYDAVAHNGEIAIYAISEHVENAGVHSGDATLVFPPQRLYLETVRRVRRIAREIAAELQINGPFNIQFIARHNDVRVIECNLRASRSFPFVSKVLETDFMKIAAQAITDRSPQLNLKSIFELDHVGVKAPQFSFTRLYGADPVLGVEMASTGEVACLGDSFNEAFIKALNSVGFRFPIESILLSTGPLSSKAELLPAMRSFARLGIKLYATPGSARFMTENDIQVTALAWPDENVHPNTLDVIQSGKVDLVVNIPKNFQKDELTNDYHIRRAAVDYGIPLITNRQLVQRLAEALDELRPGDLRIRSWQEYRQGL
jgi:carbamoyl-phosphate synthase large subunit